MALWEKLDNVSQNIANEPWSLYWNEMKSGSHEFEDFLHNPLPTLIKVLDGVDDTWTVETKIRNHEKGLLINAVCTVAMADPQKKIVYLTLFKH